MSFIMIPDSKDDFVEELQVGDEKKGGNKKIFIILLIAQTVLLAAAVVYFLFIYDKGASKSEEKGKAGTESKEKKEEKKEGKKEEKKEGKEGKEGEKGGGEGLVTELESFVVNLDDVNNSKFLKMKVSIELDNSEAQGELESKKIMIRDAILTFLSSLKVTDTTGIEGKASIKEGIINRVNNILTTGKAKNVYYNEFVVQ